MASARPPGRPVAFDRDEVLDRSVDVLWRHGRAGATTRLLERELSVGQSSLYNAFGSKDELIELAVDRYSDRLEAEVVARLDPADRAALLDFVGAVAEWVTDAEHPGCLLLNLAVEHPDQADRLVRYRRRLRRAVGPAVASFTDDRATAAERTELVVAAAIGLGLAARTGAGRAETTRLRRAISAQIADW